MARFPMLITLAGLPLLLATCTTPAVPFGDTPVAATPVAPVILHDMAIANPPYPRSQYVSYLDEPTRFEFRPRPPRPQTDETPADETDNAVADDGSYLENGILYVDPNQ